MKDFHIQVFPTNHPGSLGACFNNCKFFIAFKYSCPFCNKFIAWADCGLLLLIYIMGYLYLLFIDRADCPIFAFLQVLHCNLYIPNYLCCVHVPMIIAVEKYYLF